MADSRTLSRYWMLTNEFTQNPHPILARVRQDQPVCKLEMPDGSRAWVITRYSDAKAALSDLRFSRDINVHYAELSRQAGYKLTPPKEEANHLANLDPPRHSPLRKAISFAFTPRRADGLRPRIAEITDGLLDRIAGQTQADLVTALAEPLPVITIAELMGVPSSEWPNFLRWSEALRSLDANDKSGAKKKTVRELSTYMSKLIAHKHEEPGEDLLSALIHADDDKRLTDLEILSTGFALMTGGNDTTGSLLSGTVAALLAYPEQRAKLLADPSRWPTTIDELIRWVGPINNALQRITVEPVEIGGVTIPSGELVIISVISTNRDAEQFPDRPDELDLDRPKPSHLTFGHGIHYCSGAHLAKAITEIAVTRLFARFPNLRLAVDADQLEYAQSAVVHPLVSLPVLL